MEDLKHTKLFDIHKKAGGKMVEFFGWEMPIQYSSIKEEHNGVRDSAGLFDVSHMGEILIQGNEAVKFVEKLITNSVSKLEFNQICYSPMCYKDGGIVDDLLAYKFSDTKIMLVVNASNVEKDYNWILENSKGFDVNITNISRDMTQLALQGPKAQDILQKLTDNDLSIIKFFFFKEVDFKNGLSALVSRTGYTGEDGFEIYLSNGGAVELWEMIMSEGEEYGIKPVGLGARDTLRFEAKLMLYGNDINKDTTPIEAGLKWAVDFHKDFIGKERILAQKENKPKKYLVGFKMIQRGVPRHGQDIFIDGEKAGVVTSGTYGPYVEKFLGLGYVPYDNRKRGTILEIDMRGRKKEAKIIRTPFYRKKYKK